MDSRLMILCSFDSERNFDYILVRKILDENNIGFSVENKNHAYYEGDMNLGIHVVISITDYRVASQLLIESGNKELKKLFVIK